MKRAVLFCVGIAVSSLAPAVPMTLSFRADNFVNAGTAYPGLGGPVLGSISWNASSADDPITALTGIDLTIQGHTYSLAEVGIANNSSTVTAFGALARGANAVVGDGAFNDFLIVVDRVNPAIQAFAYSLEGKDGAIWWTPTSTKARFGPLATMTMTFSASGFVNAGTQYAGFDDPVSGSISWKTLDLEDPIAALSAIDLTIQGHAYSLAEVGIANNSSNVTALGALPRGANAVVGDGAFDDFLMVFDRVTPDLQSFAYSLEGKTGAIWWTPAVTSAQFVSAASVPAPASMVLLASAMLAWGAAGRRGKRRHIEPASEGARLQGA